ELAAGALPAWAELPGRRWKAPRGPGSALRNCVLPPWAMAGCWPPRKRRTKNMMANTTRAIRIALERNSRNAPLKPRWDSSAAIPRPAAMPAMGPRKRDMPLRLALAAAPAVAPDRGAVALRVVLAAGGVAAERWLVMLLDCVPKPLPPPMRRASASKGAASMPPAETISTAMARNREKRCDMGGSPVGAARAQSQKPRFRLVILQEP